MISKDEQITPHLFALESFTIRTPASLKSSSRAAGVMKRFAPSTTSRDEGTPEGSTKDLQFVSLIVDGRPPAGMKASAEMRLCCSSTQRVRSEQAADVRGQAGGVNQQRSGPTMVLRALRPSSVSTVCTTPRLLSLSLLNSATGNSSRTKRSSSPASSPGGTPGS